MVITRGGVSLDELEKGGSRPTGFDTTKEFPKKRKSTPIFWIFAIIVALVIGALILYALTQVHH